MATVIPFEPKLRTRLAEQNEAREQEDEIRIALGELQRSGEHDREALHHLTMRCCYEPALIIPPEHAGVLKKRGLMEAGGGITETVKAVVRQREDALWHKRPSVTRLPH